MGRPCRYPSYPNGSQGTTLLTAIALGARLCLDPESWPAEYTRRGSIQATTSSPSSTTGQSHHRYSASGAALVLGELRIERRLAAVQLVPLAALGEGRGDGDSVGADLDADLGICDEVVIPVWTGGRTRLGCEHDPSVTIGQVHQRVDPGLPALGSHGVLLCFWDNGFVAKKRPRKRSTQ